MNQEPDIIPIQLLTRILVACHEAGAKDVTQAQINALIAAVAPLLRRPHA